MKMTMLTKTKTAFRWAALTTAFLAAAGLAQSTELSRAGSLAQACAAEVLSSDGTDGMRF